MPRHTGPAKRPNQYDPTTPAQRYQFVGTLASATPAGDKNLAAVFDQQAFTVLAGEGGATITSGWAKWGVIDRPRRVGMTVLQGYDPIVMEVPVRFDDVVHQDGADVERDIQKLHWMAGRGKLFAADGHVGASGIGDSPIVNVYSSDGHGRETPLIPPDVQGIDWVISGLVFDPNPSRGRDGYRIRQDATVTLTQFVAAPGNSLDSPSVRARARRALRNQYAYFPVTAAHDTIRKIVTFDAHNPSHDAAVEVLRLNKERLKLGSSVDAPLLPHLKPGARIKVPKAVVLSR